MVQTAANSHDYEWVDYYEQFPYFSPEAVRDGCHPRIREQDDATRAVVLVHGLTDSPYFMTAIADYFFSTLGYNVYLPLLHFHGLKDPAGMEGVSLEEWKANVNFAVDTAAARAGTVSIGGLSTGGTLSFYTAVNNDKITGALYLFSAALDLAGGIIGDFKEFLLRTRLVDILDKNEPLIGPNPYRYAGMDLDGATELSKLIKETDKIVKGFNAKEPFTKRVFAAHSESDKTAGIRGIERLEKVSDPDTFEFFRIPKGEGVSHASLVLKDDIFATGASESNKPLEEANPLFGEMMAAVANFQK